MPATLRSLYVCYLSLEDPLVQTQVVAYLEGLAARGHTIHLLTYEPQLSPGRRNELAADLEQRGIAWHSLRYHKRPSLPATVYDALVGAFVARRLVRRHRLDAIHARSHVPAATALIVRRLSGRPFIFDIRGLLGEEYVDAGRWRAGGVAHRLTDRIQRAAIARAAGIVVLTERVRAHLFGEETRVETVVIPCCTNLDRVTGDPEGIRRVRARLGLGERPVMVYAGKLTEPYLDREMVEFFTVARDSDPTLAFLILTQAPPESMRSELERPGIPEFDYRITRCDPADLGDYLGVADFAICFCRPSFARIASSPTKVGEYLAAGLPVVSGPAIGDVDEVLAGRRVGSVIDSFDAAAYESGALAVRELAADPACRERCRETAHELFSLQDVGIPRYDRLYREVGKMAVDHDEDRR